MDKQKISDFKQFLKIKNRYGNYPIGLAVYKTQEEKDFIIDNLEPTESISISGDMESENPQEIIESLKKIFSNSGTLLIELESSEQTPLWSEQIKRLTQSNAVFVEDKEKNDNFYHEMSDEQTVIFLISNDNLENNTDTDFINHFKTVLKV